MGNQKQLSIFLAFLLVVNLLMPYSTVLADEIHQPEVNTDEDNKEVQNKEETEKDIVEHVEEGAKEQTTNDKKAIKESNEQTKEVIKKQEEKRLDEKSEDKEKKVESKKESKQEEVREEKLTVQEVSKGINYSITASKDKIESGKTFYYDIQYSTVDVEGDLAAGYKIEVPLQNNVEFVEGELQKTGDITKAFYDKDGHKVVFVFTDKLEGGKVGTLSFGVKFPNYITPNGEETEAKAVLKKDDQVLLESEPAKTTAIADAKWEVTKSSPGAPNPKNVTYTLDFRSLLDPKEVGQTIPKNVVLKDELPQGAVFKEASDGGQYDAKTHSVIWNIGDLTEEQVKSRTIITVSVNVEYPNAAFGETVTNIAKASFESGESGEPIETEDKVEHGFTLNGRDIASMDVTKWVKGELDTDWSRNPNIGKTRKGGSLEYKLIMENTGNVVLKDLYLIDVFPHKGDTGVIDSTARKSEWSPVLAGPIETPAFIEVKYSTNENITMEVNGKEDPNNNWSTTMPANPADVTAVKFTFKEVESKEENDQITTIIKPGQKVEIKWKMQAPKEVEDGEVAWNSVGYSVFNEYAKSWEKVAEPKKVGITVEEPLVNLGDYVWEDTNKNGLQDEDEKGIAGVIVNLLDQDGHQLAKTTTDENGFYIFKDLEIGKYEVEFMLPEGYEFTKEKQGDDSKRDSNANPETGRTGIIDLTEDDMTWDAGIYLIPGNTTITKDVEGKEHLDVIREKTYQYHVVTNIPNDIKYFDKFIITDEVDAGLTVNSEEVIVTVDGKSSDAVKLTVDGNDVKVEVTNFAALHGKKQIELVIPAKIKADTDLTQYENKLIPNTATLDFTNATGKEQNIETKPVTVTPPLVSLGDYVWEDTNKNGLQDEDEKGIAGVIVNLLDQDGHQLAKTTTDENGFYIFKDLEIGKYEVEFMLPEGYEFTKEKQGDDSKRDSNANPETGRTGIIDLTEDDMTWDAGIYLISDNPPIPKDPTPPVPEDPTPPVPKDPTPPVPEDPTTPVPEDPTTPTDQEKPNKLGIKLPKTATNTLNILLMGMSLIVLGIAFKVLRKRNII